MAKIRIDDTYVPTRTQLECHKAQHRYKLFGGAMGGGKSRWLCEEVKNLSLKYPGNRIVMARFHLSEFKNSTLKTLLECLQPELILSHNLSEGRIHLVGGSEIIYMGMSSQEEIEKLKSMELGAFAFDEASEIPKTAFLMAQSRLRRILPGGGRPFYCGILTSNPADCWLKDYFLHGEGGDDCLFVPSLPRDNPFLPEDYVDQLKKTFPEDWVSRFLEGSWDDLSSGNEIIKSDWIRMAVNREIPVLDKPVIACDVARYGDDEIVIYFGKGNCLIEQDITTQKSTTETSGRLVAMYNKKHAKLVVVDDAGIGGGVTDQLREMKVKTLAVNGGESSTDAAYTNLKTQLWYHASKLFEHGKVSILNEPRLLRQLSAVKYIYRSNGKIMAEPKVETKKRLGYSPDRADALILMLWGASRLRDPARDFMRKHDGAGFLKGGRSNPYGWRYHTDEKIEVNYA